MSEAYEKAREAHKAGGPYKSALDAIQSKTFSKMHSERRKSTKEYRTKALENVKVGEWNKKHLETKSGKGVFYKDYDAERKHYAKLNKKNGY